MKSFINYIEEQRVDEGLFSDIVLRLVDASLSWIGKGLDAIKDSAAKASEKTWDMIYAKNPYWSDREIKQYQTKYQRAIAAAFREEDQDKRLKNFDTICKYFDIDDDQKAMLYVWNLCLVNKKGNDEQIKKAQQMVDSLHLTKEEKNNVLKALNINDNELFK